MLETGKNDFIVKKSYEISYALWRVAANITETNFAGKLFKKAIDLIGDAADGNVADILEKLPGAELLIKFGVDMNCISVGNQDILLKEIGNLKSAIFNVNAANVSKYDEVDLTNFTNGKDVTIVDIFSKPDDLEDMPETKIDGIHLESISDLPLSDFEKTAVEEVKPANSTNNGIGKAETRQSAILERIRQIGNCRLNDIQAILPDCSERTIRYDLESLVQRNLVERIGIGGRGVYYRLASSN